MTAQDVVFSFERVLNPDNKSLYAQFISFIAGVEAKDERTVTIKTSHPYSLVAESLKTGRNCQVLRRTVFQ